MGYEESNHPIFDEDLDEESKRPEHEIIITNINNYF